MKTSTFQSQHPFVAGFWLMAAIPISVLVGLPTLKLLSIDMGTDNPVGNVILFLGHLVAGYLWARSLKFPLWSGEQQADEYRGRPGFHSIGNGWKAVDRRTRPP